MEVTKNISETELSAIQMGIRAIKKRKSPLSVVIVEDHNDALMYIYRAIGSKKLPFHNGAMVHFDSHPDMMIPKKMDPAKIHDKEYVLSSLSIENWIMPAVYAKHFNTLAWIKPPWASQLSNGIHPFKIGCHRDTKDIKVSCSQSYFVSELLWSPPEELEEASDIRLEVCTLGTTEQLLSLQVSNTFASEHPSETPKDLLESTKNQYQKLSPDFHQILSSTPYILDIDLDFYSTRNPFLSMFTEEQFQLLRKLYHYKHPEIDSVEDLRIAGKKRQDQLQELESILMHVKEGRSLQDLPRTSRLISMEFLLNTFPGGVVPDPGLLNDAGCTCDDCDLPHHVSSKEQIRHLVDVTKEFLLELPKPSFITIARSSRDDYCPPENVDHIQELVLIALKEIYGPIEITKDYELNLEDDDTVVSGKSTSDSSGINK